MRTLGFVVTLAAAALASGSCGSRDSEQRAVVKEWIGKKLIIPEELTFQIQDTPIDYDFNDADFKIVTYIDSTGCTGCKMKLRMWDKFINEIMKRDDVSVSFIMIINTAYSDKIKHIIYQNDFKHPISIDSDDLFNKVNEFPKHDNFRTMLLDLDNRVLAIGNPVYNPNIKELYRNLIYSCSGEILESEDIESDNYISQALGAVNCGDTIRQRFQLFNEMDNQIVLKDIIPSCHCISATVDSDRVESGCSINVDVMYVADTMPNKIYQYVDLFFSGYQHNRILLHGFANNKDQQPEEK